MNGRLNSIWIGFLVLLVASPSAAQTPDWLRVTTNATIAGAMVAHGGDIANTQRLFGRDDERVRHGLPRLFREGNPALRGLSDNPTGMAVAKFSIATGLAWMKLHYRKQHPKAVLIAAVIETVAIGYVWHRNGDLYRHQARR